MLGRLIEKKWIRFILIEAIITLVLLSPFLVPKIVGIIEYRLPLSGYLPDDIRFHSHLYLRSACSLTEGDMSVACRSKDACFAENYLIENGQWPLMDITSSTDVMWGLTNPVMAAYAIQDDKKVLNPGIYRRIYIRYGDLCYVPYRDIYAP